MAHHLNKTPPWRNILKHVAAASLQRSLFVKYLPSEIYCKVQYLKLKKNTSKNEAHSN